MSSYRRPRVPTLEWTVTPGMNASGPLGFATASGQVGGAAMSKSEDNELRAGV